ncbi:hypothetical protein DFH06DRAFT_1206881, partial [Mycena polygramma]
MLVRLPNAWRPFCAVAVLTGMMLSARSFCSFLTAGSPRVRSSAEGIPTMVGRRPVLMTLGTLGTTTISTGSGDLTRAGTAPGIGIVVRRGSNATTSFLPPVPRALTRTQLRASPSPRSALPQSRRPQLETQRKVILTSVVWWVWMWVLL